MLWHGERKTKFKAGGDSEPLPPAICSARITQDMTSHWPPPTRTEIKKARMMANAEAWESLAHSPNACLRTRQQAGINAVECRKLVEGPSAQEHGPNKASSKSPENEPHK